MMHLIGPTFLTLSTASEFPKPRWGEHLMVRESRAA
jgi:hypothetical protein